MSSPAASVDLADLPREELRTFLESIGQPKYRGDQLFRWIWQRGARSFEEMTDLPKALRARLAGTARIGSARVEHVARSTDGTRKLLVRLRDGKQVEAVIIPERKRMTLCISSQVGCALGCRFCATGKLGLTRHMTAGEIVQQVALAGDVLREDGVDGPGPPERPITHIVYMGMGEPLHNTEGTLASLEMLTDEQGFAYAPKRITLSTVGMVPQMLELGERVPVNLAVSLHAADDALRGRIMPINRKYDLAQVLEACRSFPLRARGRITFEYVLLAGVNDSDADASRLASLLGDLRCKVNLIPFNEHEGADFTRPTDDAVARFRELLDRRGVDTFVRTTRGRDIAAACGQLALTAAGEGEQA